LEIKDCNDRGRVRKNFEKKTFPAMQNDKLPIANVF
jgi:hypothetical protein